MKIQTAQNEFHIRTNLKSGAIWKPKWWIPQCGADRWNVDPATAAQQCCYEEGADKDWCEGIIKKCVKNLGGYYKNDNRIIECINKGNQCFDTSNIRWCEDGYKNRINEQGWSEADSHAEYERCINSCF